MAKKGKSTRPGFRSDVCFYCNRLLIPGENKTCDHIVPLKYGGINKQRNRIPACMHCNSVKGSSTLDEFEIISQTHRKILPETRSHVADRIELLRTIIAKEKLTKI